jgi:DNA mismatch repair ATPase MutL
MKELSLHILDIAMNSVRAKCSVLEIKIFEDNSSDMLKIYLKDNGVGMSKDMVESVLDPFTTTRTTRKVGLGIPLFKANAENCNGEFSIKSELNIGTEVTAIFQLSNIDRPILGNITSVVVMLLTSHPDVEIIFYYNKDGNEFMISTSEIKLELGGVSIQEDEVRNLLNDIISSKLEALKIID